MKGLIFGTVGGTLTSKRVLAVVVAFERHVALVGKDAVEFGFLANGGLVLSNRPGNGRFSGVVSNAGKGDSSFFQR